MSASNVLQISLYFEDVYLFQLAVSSLEVSKEVLVILILAVLEELICCWFLG